MCVNGVYCLLFDCGADLWHIFLLNLSKGTFQFRYRHFFLGFYLYVQLTLKCPEGIYATSVGAWAFAFAFRCLDFLGKESIFFCFALLLLNCCCYYFIHGSLLRFCLGCAFFRDPLGCCYFALLWGLRGFFGLLCFLRTVLAAGGWDQVKGLFCFFASLYWDRRGLLFFSLGLLC